jgi:hypothetical protein
VSVTSVKKHTKKMLASAKVDEELFSNISAEILKVSTAIFEITLAT